MLIKTLVVGPFQTNCYLVACEETKEAACIDPGADGGAILEAIEKDSLEVKYIINTHGHVDHISDNQTIKDATGAKVLIHQHDAVYLTDPKKSLQFFSGKKAAISPADQVLAEGDHVKLGSTVTLEVIHTPGHTPGGICLKTDQVLFTGDTLFAGSVGRTDFPGGSFGKLISSIKEKLLPLGEGYRIYPGHGPGSTLGEERSSNPFLT